MFWGISLPETAQLPHDLPDIRHIKVIMADGRPINKVQFLQKAHLNP